MLTCLLTLVCSEPKALHSLHHAGRGQQCSTHTGDQRSCDQGHDSRAARQGHVNTVNWCRATAEWYRSTGRQGALERVTGWGIEPRPARLRGHDGEAASSGIPRSKTRRADGPSRQNCQNMARPYFEAKKCAERQKSQKIEPAKKLSRTPKVREKIKNSPKLCSNIPPVV